MPFSMVRRGLLREEGVKMANQPFAGEITLAGVHFVARRGLLQNDGVKSSKYWSVALR